MLVEALPGVTEEEEEEEKEEEEPERPEGLRPTWTQASRPRLGAENLASEMMLLLPGAATGPLRV